MCIFSFCSFLHALLLSLTSEVFSDILGSLFGRDTAVNTDRLQVTGTFKVLYIFWRFVIKPLLIWTYIPKWQLYSDVV